MPGAHALCTREPSSPLALRENLASAAPAQATEVRVWRDDAAFHAHFTCIDRDPWATITQRDGPLWEEEVVELFIDPVGDGECYFEIELNPLGTVLDLVLRRSRSGYKKDFAWDCDDLRTAATRTPDGWTAEFTIPFLSIAASAPASGHEWRINFTRIDRPRDRDRELSAWSPTRLATFHAPDRFGTLRFT